MIGVVFFLEDIDNRLNIEMIDETVFNARMMGATHIFMIDITQYNTGMYYQHGDAEIEFERYQELDDLIDNYPDEKLVFLENHSSFEQFDLSHVDIIDYQHPEDCIYIFGPDSGQRVILESSGTENEDYVNIHSVNNIFSHAALIITLYDRITKQ